MKDFETLDIRPYQLLAIVERIGAGYTEDLGDTRLTAILKAVREKPYRPVRLRANVSSVYLFQNPGHDEDTPGGDMFNAKRDLDILQRLGLTPGIVMPAIDLFALLLRSLPQADAICGYDGDSTGTSWPAGDPVARANYAKGVTLGLSAVIPARDDAELACVKKESARAILEADHLYIRPHHVMCMTCFLGGHLDNFEPIAEDNLQEAIIAMQKNTNIPITLIQGPCMICPPCHAYDPKTNLCYLSVGIGLRDEKKDLDVLRLLGLKYGDTLPAQEYLRLLYERIPSTKLICSYCDGIERDASWRVCDGPEGSERYRKGRTAWLAKL